uniref:Uncharacterized protein n=1 Tax=Anopheles farauti TaxID=69004 RepID=A0A182QMM7_9DIPT
MAIKIIGGYEKGVAYLLTGQELTNEGKLTGKWVPPTVAKPNANPLPESGTKERHFPVITACQHKPVVQLQVELYVLLPGGVGQQQLQVAHVVLADAQLLQAPQAGHFRAGLPEQQEFRFHLKFARDVFLHLVERVVAWVGVGHHLCFHEMEFYGYILSALPSAATATTTAAAAAAAGRYRARRHHRPGSARARQRERFFFADAATASSFTAHLTLLGLRAARL